jgi:site-specific DNA-methyltransferase (adenine-specific)
MNEVMFSKRSDEWETPQWLFDLLDEEFHFTFDAAATRENTKCRMYGDKKWDGLHMDWSRQSEGGAVWLNPPYSNIARFLRKAYWSSVYGVTVVCLIPSRTDTKYWHEYVMYADEVRLVKGRLRFSNSDNSAPFPSAIVVFRPRTSNKEVSYPRFSTFDPPPGLKNSRKRPGDQL